MDKIKTIFSSIWSKTKSVSKKVWNFLFPYKHWILIALVGILLFFAGWFANRHFNPRIVERPTPVTVTERVEVPVEVPVAVKGDTVIQYVPKESPADADIQIKQDPAQISMQYNDKIYKIDTLKDETQKFEKGKLDVQQSSSATLDVTPIVDREVKIAVSDNTKKVTEQVTAEKDKEIKQVKKDESKKRTKTALETFAIGLGTGLLIGF